MDEDVMGAIMACLDHVIIKTKEDPNYEPHPLLKAMVLAVQTNKDGNCMGVSYNGGEKKDTATEAYSVIMERKNGKFKLIDIIDLTTGNKLSIIDVLLIVELSLKLEKIDGDIVHKDKIKQLLDEVYKDVKFEVVSPSNFKPARDYFKKMLEERRVSIPPDEDLKKGLLSIKTNTKWEDYPQKIRSLIVCAWAAKDKKFGISIDSEEMPKDKVIHMFKTFFIGEFRDIILKNIKSKKD